MMSDSGGAPARRVAMRFLAKPADQRLGDARRAASEKVRVQERPFFHELVIGATKRQALLDAILQVFSNAPLNRIEKKLLANLRAALYQVFFMASVPEHAAVSESLKLLPSRKARGFANGILRSILRETEVVEGEPSSDESAAIFSLTDNRHLIVKRSLTGDAKEWSRFEKFSLAQGFTVEAGAILKGELGEADAQALMLDANLRSMPSIRVEGERPQELMDLEGVEWLNDSGSLLGLPVGLDPARLDGFEDGRITVQGPFAAGVIALFDEASLTGLTLDLCAPPGGKTVQLASQASSESVTAFAQDQRGADRLKQTLTRMKTDNVSVVRDAAEVWKGGPYAKILLDVPCSNTGVMKKRPEARLRLDQAHLKSLHRLQASILDRALKHLDSQDQGALVYSTCSVLPSENEVLLRRALSAYEGFELVKEQRSMPQGPYGDGGYAALVVRRR